MTPAARARPRLLPMAYPSKASSADVFADISDNNLGFDAQQYASAGHGLIAIKATQGQHVISPSWAQWTQAAHSERVAVAHYHFCQLENPRLEAEHFWETIRPHFKPGWDRLVLDLEVGPQSDWPLYLSVLDNELERLSGLQAIGYTFASGLSPQLEIRSGKWWVAAWGTAQPGGRLRQLPNGTLWAWQYAQGFPAVHPSGGPAAAAGIGACDMSVLAPPIVSLIRKATRR